MTPRGDVPVEGAERRRIGEDQRSEVNWRRFGPYLADRQWATVREDYSPDGTCWDYFPHDHARSRVYRWGEDGLLGFTDRECRLCIGLALWNGRDPILKERPFGVTGPEGNHGEDVKELYYYLDATPTFSYFAMLYKYPQREYPYRLLSEESRRRGRADPELEIGDTGVFDDSRYFDVLAEYAKAGPDDILIRVTCTNRGPEASELHVLPQVWLRNTWAWGRSGPEYPPKGRLSLRSAHTLAIEHPTLGSFTLAYEPAAGIPPPQMLFTDNETNAERLFGATSASRFVKDAFHRRVIAGEEAAVNPEMAGTKAAAWYWLRLPPGGQTSIRLRLTGIAARATRPDAASGAAAAESGAAADWDSHETRSPFDAGFEDVFAARRAEADQFHLTHRDAPMTEEERRVVRQADAGLLASRQFYHYVVGEWLEGDPAQPTPPAGRRSGRNAHWANLHARDLLAMPDKWEYPWFAAWDHAFHAVAMARIDPTFAKDQLLLLCREWYMHPNGQMPAYEFAFGDVNPPVHAWAAWRVYQLAAERGYGRDRSFLERAFQKCIVNFTWWVNRKDIDGNNLFAGGFLGLDNIGVFDRSKPLPSGGRLEQADATAWMAFYCTTMMAIALELAHENHAYADIASKFFEHFVTIAQATNELGGTGLWDEGDGFYYDQIHLDGRIVPLKIRSMVGLIPLYAAETLDEEHLVRLPMFRQRVTWVLENRSKLATCIAMSSDATSERRLLAIPSRERLERMLRYLLDEGEFLSPYGIRSLSRVHLEHPYTLEHEGHRDQVRYTPGVSDTWLFGGNSNWRGPVWFPVNYLLIEALKRHHHFYRDTLRVECPTGSGRYLTLLEVAQELEVRLARLFLSDATGRRPCHGDDARHRDDPHFRDLLLFHEYFHGDTGRGLGASHQTGWTALAGNVIERVARARAGR